MLPLLQRFFCQIPGPKKLVLRKRATFIPSPFVSFTPLVAVFFLTPGIGVNAESAAALFQLLDANHDGLLDRGEFLRHIFPDE